MKHQIIRLIEIVIVTDTKFKHNDQTRYISEKIYSVLNELDVFKIKNDIIDKETVEHIQTNRKVVDSGYLVKKDTNEKSE